MRPISRSTTVDLTCIIKSDTLPSQRIAPSCCKYNEMDGCRHTCIQIASTPTSSSDLRGLHNRKFLVIVFVWVVIILRWLIHLRSHLCALVEAFALLGPWCIVIFRTYFHLCTLIVHGARAYPDSSSAYCPSTRPPVRKCLLVRHQLEVNA